MFEENEKKVDIKNHQIVELQVGAVWAAKKRCNLFSTLVVMLNKKNKKINQIPQ